MGTPIKLSGVPLFVGAILFSKEKRKKIKKIAFSLDQKQYNIV